MLLLSASSKIRVLGRQLKHRYKPYQARRRGAFVSAPETLECRLLLASDIFAEQHAEVGDNGEFHGEPFPDLAAVHGTKWNDQNANGERDANETGLAGVTIYSDINRNGLFEDWEPSTVTIEGSPFEDFAERGSYWLDLEPGIHVIREVVPAGAIQTFPATVDPQAGNPDGQGPNGQDPDQFATARPERLVLPDEPGHPLDTEVSLTVHPFCIRAFELDVISSHPDVVDVINMSGPQLNGCGGDTTVFEVSIISHQFDIPSLPRDLSLQFVDLLGGDALASIPIVPFSGGADGAHIVELFPGDVIEGADFGNHFAEPTGSVHGVKWADWDGDGQRDDDEPGLPGVTIYSDVNRNGQPDSFEPRTMTMEDNPDTDFDEAGMYWLEDVRPGENAIREVVPPGYRQTFPGLDLHIGDSELGRHHQGPAFDLDVTDGNASVTGGGVHVELELTVVWPDSCGTLDTDLTSHAVVGDHILVELRGHQEGNVCAAVISPESTTIEIPGLDDRAYTVVTTLHEDLRDGQQNVATLAAVTNIDVVHRDFHVVDVRPGQAQEDINFGNQPLPPGQVHGSKWLDSNGNARRDDHEPGLAGVTVYSDLNFNGMLDDDEPYTVTMDDNPDTEINETGRYWLEELTPGEHSIREVVPDGSVQTFPIGPIIAFDGFFPPFPGFEAAHHILLESGEVVDGIDFGNRPIEPGSIHGRKWLDANGNLWCDDDEPGLAGVTIYVDSNMNGVFDSDEPHTETMADAPHTFMDESGMYWLEDLIPGFHIVREIVPDGFVQTFPEIPPPPIPIDPVDGNVPIGMDLIFYPYEGAHFVTLDNGGVVEGIDFGNREFEPANVHGTKWRDVNGDSQRDADEPGLPGVTIYVDLNHNFEFDEDEPHTVTMEDDPNTDFDEGGMYWLEGLDPGLNIVREVVPDGFRQTFPFSWDIWQDDGVPFPQPPPDVDGGHWLYLEVGDAREGIDFGNQEFGSSSIHGTKWVDRNGNGARDPNEPGLPGVTIYIDLNGNGMLDGDEPHTRTMEDDPDTDFDEGGRYWLENVETGRNIVREVVPDGFVQTFPRGDGRFVIDGVVSEPIQPLVVHDFTVGQPNSGSLSINEITFLITMGGCADLLAHETEFEVVRGQISVNIYVDSSHELACDAEIVTVPQSVNLGPLDPGGYELRSLLFELGHDGQMQESFVLEAVVEVGGSNGAHVVDVAPNQHLEGVDFGNRPTDAEGASVHGTKWLDRNGNGRRDEGEPGLPGVVIYSDLNFNGQLDEGEPRTRTMEGNSATGNRAGHYWLEVQPGDNYIREVVPAGFVQTFPRIDPSAFISGGHGIVVEPGEVLDGIDFGNRRIETEGASIHGLKWFDQNGDGERQDNEPVLPDVTIYLDVNLNARFDEGEPHTLTMHDDPDTEAIESGRYWLEAEPGFYLVREVVPEGYEQTFPPILLCEATFCVGRAHLVNLEPGQRLDGLDFGNDRIDQELGSIHGRKWVDRNGNGQRDDNEPGMPGVEILLYNGDGLVARTETMEDDPDTERNERGEYWFEGLVAGMYAVEEIVPNGFHQTFPGFPDICHVIDLPAGSPFCTVPQHLVELEPGEVIDGLDFGNQPLDNFPAAIHGLKWLDRNGNGRRDDGEPGLAGVTIWIDANLNGVFDADDPHTVTMEDDATTPHNDTGRYWFENLEAGFKVVREVVPDGFARTFPDPFFCRAIFCNGHGHMVTLAPGEVVDGLDFGNQPIDNGGQIRGVKWLDRNSNGQHDDDEPGLPGVTVYLDLNNNRSLDRGEPRTETSFDNPRTHINEAGHYRFRLPEAGTYIVREVVPDGFRQTFPHRAGVAVGETIVVPRKPIHVRGFDLASASYLVTANGMGTVELDFNVFWSDGCGSILHDESDVAIGDNGQINITVFTRNEQAWGDVLCTADAPVHTTTVNVGSLSAGRHPLRTELQEVTPDGNIIAYVVESAIVVGSGDGSHTVRLEAGEIVDGVNFGNVRLPDAPRMVFWNAAEAADVPNGWEDEQNWEAFGENVSAPNAAPAAGDDVVFGPDFANVVELGSDQTIRSIRFMDDYHLVGGNALTITSGQITVDGGAVVTFGVDVDAGEMLYKLGEGTLLITGSAPGDVQLDAGVLGGTTQLGSLNVADGAVIAPGTSVGVMMVDSATFGEQSTLEIEIGGLTAGTGHDQLFVHGGVSLAGNLELQLLDQFLPTRGTTESITVLAAAEVTGRFAEADRHLGRGVFYDATYRSDAVQISLYTALPGDANGDGSVDGIDFGIWHTNAYSGGDWADGDFDGDGIVDVRDFNIWNDSKFTVAQAASPGANTVPRAAVADGIDVRIGEAVPVLKVVSEKLRRHKATETKNEAIPTEIGAAPTETEFVRSSETIRQREMRSVRRHVSRTIGGLQDDGWTNLVDDAFTDGGNFDLF